MTNCNKCIHHTSGNCDSWDCNMQTVEDAKNEAVNEYAKMVVEEFDKKYNNSLWIKGDEEFSITRNELIEIVKHGGVSDDVCDWKYSSITGNWDSDRHKKVIKDAIACDWKVCPYCGKKIKVVE